MRIVYLIERIDSAGGIQRSLSVRANELVERYEHEIVIVCTEKSTGIPYYRLHPKIRLVFLDSLTSKPSVLGRILLRHRQSKQIKRLNPDLIISAKYTLHNLFFHFLRGPAKLVSELREPKALYMANITSIKSKINATIRNWVFAKQDLLILLTEADKRNWGFANAAVVPNPLTIDVAQQSPLTNKKVLAVGRLTAVKGYDKLLAAWQIVSKQYPDWHLKICGEGELYAALIEQAERLGILDTLEIPNMSASVIPEYLSSSVFVLTSQYEAFGNVLLEAKACGVPSVAFDCPEGPREIICDGEDGFLVELNNVSDFASKIMLLIEDQQLRTAMGRRALTNAAKYHPDAIISKYHEALLSVLPGNATSKINAI